MNGIHSIQHGSMSSFIDIRQHSLFESLINMKSLKIIYIKITFAFCQMYVIKYRAFMGTYKVEYNYGSFNF